MQKAMVYIRVSTLDQAREGYSLAAQERALREWCGARGYDVLAVYADEGISAKDIKRRPAMLSLLSDVQRGEADVVLVWALSRLTRSVADLYDIWDTLQVHGVDLISYTEPFDTSTPVGRAMMGMLGVFAQMEREFTAERVRSAMAERAAQGKRTTNEVLGYDLSGKDTLTVNPAEAERVRYIFTKYLEYRNLSVVAELCALKGYRGKRGGAFRAQNIKVILTRAVYCGYASYCGELHAGTWEPIIPVDVFNRAQKMLKCKIIADKH